MKYVTSQIAKQHSQNIKNRFGDNTGYLGDGAYVGYDGFAFIVFTSNGLGIQNEISLEDRAIRSLNRFVEDMYEAKQEKS